MIKTGEIFFNGMNTLKDLNLKMKDYSEIEIPNRQYEEVEVSGRNGTLLYDLETYPNINITIDFDLVTYEYINDYNRINQWLNNITDNRLIIDNSGKCYRVIKVIKSVIKQEDYRSYNFPLTFLCEPFITDYDSNEYEYKNKNIKVPYEGNVSGKPIIELYGSGDIQITTNNETLSIVNVIDYIKIDSELLEVVDSNGNSKEWDTLGDFPLFNYGENEIKVIGNVNKIKVSIINKYI